MAIPKDGISTEAEPAVAVLIDADNTSHEAIKYILDACARYGRTIIRRAYGDWTTEKLRPWGGIFKDFAIKPEQQFQYTTGKNSTDIAMIIDALDLLHERRLAVFVLVSSDSDFTALATRIREDGVTVIGIGRQTTPSSFVKGCDQFLLIENMIPAPSIEVALPEPAPGTIPMPEAQPAHGVDDKGRDLLIRAAKQASDPNGIIRGSFLGIVLKRLDPRFAPSNYGVTKLSDFVALHHDIVVPTGKRSGDDPTYKLVTT